MPSAARRTVVRAPNHLGDLVMALPALRAADADSLVVPRGLAPLLALASLRAAVVPFDRGVRGMAHAARRLRDGSYDRGILLPPSLSSALLFRFGGVRHLRGTDTDGRRLLLDDAVPRAALRGLHRSAAYLLLATGVAPPEPEPPVPVLAVTDEARAEWRTLATDHAEGAIGLFPGGNAPSRRWPPARFAELAGALAALGERVVVFGGPDERALTRAVAAGVADRTRVLDVGGQTPLPTLAAALASVTLLVSNDSGPLHLAAAVGADTLSLWGAGDPAVTRPLGGRRELLRHPELPCVPCVQNLCPRSGAGSVLPAAHNECLHLIGVQDVLDALAAPRTAAARAHAGSHRHPVRLA